MKLRNLTQRVLRKTATTLQAAEAKLEPTPCQELRAILKDADLPTPVLLQTLCFLQAEIERLEKDDA